MGFNKSAKSGISEPQDWTVLYYIGYQCHFQSSVRSLFQMLGPDTFLPTPPRSW